MLERQPSRRFSRVAADENTREMDTHDAGGPGLRGGFPKDEPERDLRKDPEVFSKASFSLDPVGRAHDTMFDRMIRWKVGNAFEFRYFVIPIYVYMAFAGGLFYFGWSGGLRDLLSREGAYAWQCEDAQTRPAEEDGNELKNGAYRAVCSEQTTSIGYLLTVSTCAHMVFSSLSGVVLDRTSPRFTALVGAGMRVIGTAMMFCSTQSFQAYIPGFVVFGASVDFCFMPIVSAGCGLFNGRFIGVIVCVLGAAMSASTAIPIVLFQVAAGSDPKPPDVGSVRLWQLGLGYIGVGVLSFAVLAFFFLPSRTNHFESTEQDGLELRASAYEMRAEGRTADPLEPARRRGSARVVEMGVPSEATATSLESTAGGGGGKTQLVVWFRSKVIEEGRDFRKYLFSPSYFLYIPFFTILVLRSLYMSSSAGDQLASSVDSLWAWIRPFNSLACICFGFLTDIAGIFVSTFVLNLQGTLIFLLILGKALVWQYMLIGLSFFYSSFCFSSCFAYVQNTQPARHFGKLSGIANTFAGLLQLTAIPLYRLSKETLNNDFLPVNMLMLGLSLVAFGLWGYLVYVRLRTHRRRAASVNKSVWDMRLEEVGAAAEMTEEKKTDITEEI